MESARRQFLERTMTEEEYRRKASMETILALEDQDYFLEGQLGVGSFGVIVELMNKTFRQRVAAKIVLQEYVTESEQKLWPSLEHQNVLKLNDTLYVPESYCYVFFMDMQPAALDKLLEDPSFGSDVHSFKRAISWLRGISEGVQYLHGQKLAHLDLKLGNVLISESDTAKLCDFGSLTRTECAADSYQSPFLYRAPEGLIYENGEQAVVDAFSYDIYNLGMLSLELFTSQTLFKSFAGDWTDSNPSWTEVMYPRIFDVLEAKKFKELVKKTFANTKMKDETVDIMRDFVRGCIRMNPRDRPSIDEVLQHKIFGGPNLFPKKKNGVWISKASDKKIQFLLSLYVGRAASLRLPRSSLAVFESRDVDEWDNNGTPDEPIEIKGDASKEKEESDECAKTVRIGSERRNVFTWFGEKKRNLSTVMNSFLAAFRRFKK